MKRRPHVVPLHLCAAILSVWWVIGPSPTRAQTTVGSVSGTVIDQDGAVIAGAEVTLRDLDRAVQRRATSNDSGAYTIPAVPPGRYSLAVQREGYERYVLEEFQLLINEARTIDARLGVGSFEDTVTLTVAPSPLRSNDATVSTVIKNQEVVEVPRKGQHFTQLILLAPGTAPVQTGQHSTFMIAQGAGDLRAGYNQVAIPFRNVPLGADFRAAVGPDLAQEVPNGFLPTTMALVGSGFSSASFNNFDLANPDESFQVNANFQKARGKHELSFGGRYMRWRHIVGRQGGTSMAFVPQTTNQRGGRQ